MEDYTNKYKGEQIEVALFGGEYQEGVLTAYCSIEDVPTSSSTATSSCRYRTSPRCTARVAATPRSRTGLRGLGDDERDGDGLGDDDS